MTNFLAQTTSSRRRISLIHERHLPCLVCSSGSGVVVGINPIFKVKIRQSGEKDFKPLPSKNKSFTNQTSPQIDDFVEFDLHGTTTLKFELYHLDTEKVKEGEILIGDHELTLDSNSPDVQTELNFNSCRTVKSLDQIAGWKQKLQDYQQDHQYSGQIRQHIKGLLQSINRDLKRAFVDAVQKVLKETKRTGQVEPENCELEFDGRDMDVPVAFTIKDTDLHINGQSDFHRTWEERLNTQLLRNRLPTFLKNSLTFVLEQRKGRLWGSYHDIKVFTCAIVLSTNAMVH